MTAPVSLNLTSPIPPPREAVILDVITAPPQIMQDNSSARLEGKITEVRRDGTVVIYTPKGQVVAAPPQGTASLRTGQTVSIDVTPATTAGTKTLSITITVMPTPPRAPTSSTSATTVPATTPPALQNYAQDLQQLLTARTAPKGTAPSPGLQPGQVIALQRLTIAQLINLLPNSTISPQIFELPRISTPLMISPGNITALTPLASLSAPLANFWAQPVPGTRISMPLSFSLATPFIKSPPLITPILSNQNTAPLIIQSTAQIDTALAHNPFVNLSPGGQTTFLPLMPPNNMPTSTTQSLTLIAKGPNGPAIWAMPAPIDPQAPGVFWATPSVSTTSLTPGTIMTVRGAASTVAMPPSPWAGILADIIDALPVNIRAELGSAARPLIPSVQNGATLATNIMLFMAAARLGDIGALMNDRVIETLRRAGKGGTIDAARDAVAKSRPSETATGEWRSMVFPMQFEGPIIPITLYWRRARDENQDTETRDEQRFILDLTFDRMGSVQMDMLYSPGRLDSILRTEHPLSMAMRGVLEQKYAGAMTRVSHTGTLNFQDGRASWVTINQGQKAMQVVA